MENKYFELYNKWKATAKSKDWNLHDTVINYEDEYFEDMTFKPNSTIMPYVE